jgi:hypothetical protein
MMSLESIRDSRALWVVVFPVVPVPVAHSGLVHQLCVVFQTFLNQLVVLAIPPAQDLKKKVTECIAC